MSGRGNEGETSERRGAVGQRVHFEALVAVGASDGAGFEAESVDMSPEGMRLRAAHLPEIGDRLLCRFDGLGGGEVAVEGEVCWRNEEARGGEFGLRFAGHDATSEEAVRAVCAALRAAAAPAEGGQPAASANASVDRGSRVRLHIEGLGSPMKARVRGGSSSNVEVGSNLEFLKVGRSLELEDVDCGARRPAYIHEVKVEIDPSTSIPQLVVTLRYDRAARANAQPHKEAATATGAETETEAETMTGAETGAAADADADAGAESDSSDPGEARSSSAESAAAIRGLGNKAFKAGASAVGRVGPALAGAGARAKGAMAGLVARIRQKRAERAEQTKAAGPRRMTAPPPAGVLRADGRRLVRDDDPDAEGPPPKRAVNKRAAAIGSFLGLTAVLAVFGLTRLWGLHGGAGPVAQVEPAPGALPPADTAAPALPGAAPGSPSGAPITANVPLFGATPLSTTEPVPPSAPPDPAAAAPPDSAVAAAAEPGAAALDQEPGSGDSDDGDPKAWGQGTVKNPTVLKLKMDGPIEQLNGAAGAMGFTVSLPDRRALSSGNDLARKDKRIASLRVVNTPQGAEVTVQFKDGVPAYLAKANGNRLEIALANEHAPKKVASKAKKSKTSKDDKDKKQKKGAKDKKPHAKH